MDTLTKAAIEGCLYDPTAVPSWPGFRPERIFEPERDLRAVKLKEERFFARLDKDPGPETVH